MQPRSEAEIADEVDSILLSIESRNDFVKQVITDLYAKKRAHKGQFCFIKVEGCIEEYYFYSRKYMQHFPHDMHEHDRANWKGAFLKACEREYAGLNALTRQLFILVKEKDMNGLRHTLHGKEINERNNIIALLAATDKNGKSLLDWVAAGRDQSFMDITFEELLKNFMKQYAVDEFSRFSAYIKAGLFNCAVRLNQSKDRLQQLLKDGADINALTDGRTPLGIAAALGKLESVKMLVELGADINKNECNNTPLGDALLRDHSDVVEYLRNLGAEGYCRFTIQ